MSPRPPAGDDIRGQVREAMTEAAARLLVERGYDGLTLAAVADEVGYTTTNVYRYFDSKADLVYAALEEGFDRFRAELARAWQGDDDPLARIGRLGRAYVAFARAYPEHYRLMFDDAGDAALAGRPPPGRDTFEYLVRAVAAGQADGRIAGDDPRSVAHALWGLLHGTLELGRAMPFIDDAQLDANLEAAFRLVAAGLTPR